MESSNRGTIAVFECRPALREGLAHPLRLAGYQVREAWAESELLELLGSATLNGAVLGLESADEHYLGLCRKLKTNPQTAEVELILVAAAFQNAEARAGGLAAGAEACLSEVIEPGELLAQVQRLVQRSRRREEERRRVEQRFVEVTGELRRRVAELEGIFNTVPIGLAIAQDPEGRQIQGNPYHERMLGLQRGEELSKRGPQPARYRVLEAGRELSVNELPMQRAVGGAFVTGQILEIVRPDGQQRILYSNAAPLFDEAGRPCGAVGAFLDVTEFKQTQQALQEAKESLAQSEAGLARAQRMAHLGNWSWDLGEEAVTWSEELFRIFGVDPKSFVPSNAAAQALLHPADRGLHAELVAQALKGEAVGPFEYRLVRPTGEERIVLASGFDVERDAKGKPVRLFGSVLDITERKQVILRKELERKRLLLELHEQAPKLTEEGLYDYALERVVQLTDSGIGFLHRVSTDQKSILLTTWNQAARSQCQVCHAIHYPIELAGRWADCLRLNRPVICNDAAAGAEAKGFPPGHLPVRRFMSIAVGEADKVRLIFGVGNKLEEYTEREVLQIQLVANELQKLLQQRQAEEALRKNEAKYRSLFENSLDAVFLTGANGQIKEANRAACKLFGMTEQELCQVGRGSIVDESAPDFKNALAERARAGKICCELVCMRKNGEKFPAEVASVLLGPGDSAFVILRDITQRKRLEEDLRQRAEEVEKVMEVAPVAIWVAHDPQCQRITGNSTANRFYEAAEGENVSATATGNPPRRFFQNGREVAAPDLPMQASASSGREVRGAEVEVRLPSGRRFWAWGHAVPLYNSAGQVRGCVAAFLDITERKQAEEALRKLSRAVEQSSAGVLITDRQGNIEYVNRRYCQVTGYSLEELLGHNPRLLKSGHTPPEQYQRLWRRLLAGQGWDGELLNRRKDGTLFWERALISALKNEAGQITHFVAVKEDISAQKRLEESLRHSQEQLRALAGRSQAVREEERTQIAREIHDVLAQELTCIKMEVVWLKGRLGKPLDASGQRRLRQRVQEMEGAADRAITSVQKIATELRPVILDTLGLCAAIEWLASDFQARTGIECQAQVPEAPPPLDREHSTALFRILQESLTNVLRHAAATQVWVTLLWQPSRITLRVQDNGRGMEGAKLDDPHSLGLVGMRERALLLGGECAIQSHLGNGTLVEVRFALLTEGLPGDGGQQEPAPPAPAEPAP